MVACSAQRKSNSYEGNTSSCVIIRRLQDAEETIVLLGQSADTDAKQQRFELFLLVHSDAHGRGEEQKGHD